MYLNERKVVKCRLMAENFMGMSKIDRIFDYESILASRNRLPILLGQIHVHRI